jgi:hypothetical protein
MKRRLLNLVLFLLLGAIVNVAVAWGCAAWSHLQYERGDEYSPADVEWARSVGFSFDASGLPTVIQRGSGLGVATCDVYPYSLWGRVGASRYSAGWPWQSLQAHFVRSDVRQDWLLKGGYALSPEVNQQRVLPYGPIWPDFALNALFYAAILWLLFSAPFTLRHHLRRRRNLCPHCAYPIGMNDVCTECGRALSSRGVFGPGTAAVTDKGPSGR